MYFFYKYCVDPKSIYLKLDDDIIWMDNNALCTLVDYRINNPEYFLVSPIVINNGLCAYALYNSGKLKLSRYLKAYMEDVAGWCSPKFSEKYHRWFYDIIKSNCVEDVMISNKEIAMNRFSINAVSFFGSSFNEFSGEVVGDDEGALKDNMERTAAMEMDYFAQILVRNTFEYIRSRFVIEESDVKKIVDVSCASPEGRKECNF